MECVKGDCRRAFEAVLRSSLSPGDKDRVAADNDLKLVLWTSKQVEATLKRVMARVPVFESGSSDTAESTSL